MQVICADIRGLDESKASHNGRSKSPGSGFAYSLLAYAIVEYWGCETLPEIVVDVNGKPYFHDHPDWHFSLSHTGTHVLAAISDQPIGADIESQRDLTGRLILNTMDEHESKHFGFLDLWVLRESLYKLQGKGDLRGMHFQRRDDIIVAPTPGVSCCLYSDIPLCHTAVCCYEGEFPERLIVAPSSVFLFRL